jgi:hypothetical protein
MRALKRKTSKPISQQLITANIFQGAVQLVERAVQMRCLKSPDYIKHLPEENKMATSHKKIGIYTATGIAIAIILIAAIFVSGVHFPGSNSSPGKTGTLAVSIMDAPANLTNLNVTVSGLYVHNDDNDSWTQMNFTGDVSSVYFNLLALNNITKELSTTAFPTGNYTKIRLDISAANATLSDGSTENLTVPPGHIDIIVSFQIKTDQTTNVLLDMQVDTVAISHSGNLKPVMKATVQYMT